MKTTNLYKTYNIILRIAIVILAGYFLVDQLFIHKGLQEIVSRLSLLASRRHFITMAIVVLLLMPFNWGLEAWKWKLIVSCKEHISFFTAYKAVLAGVTISSLTPNRTGEFLGRIFILKKYNFWEGALVSIVGSYAQTFNTFFWGTVSLFVLVFPFIGQGPSPALVTGGFVAALAGLILLLLFYFKISLLLKLVKPQRARLYKVISVLRRIETPILSGVLALSFVRYCVFSLQFYLLLLGSGLHLPPGPGLMLIATMFLLNTLRPSIALMEIGLRLWSAMLIFKYYYEYYVHTSQYPEAGLMATTGVIWLINIVLPALIGLVFIKDLRFFKKSKGL